MTLDFGSWPDSGNQLSEKDRCTMQSDTVFELMEANNNTLGIFATREHAIASVVNSYKEFGEVKREDFGDQAVFTVVGPDGIMPKKLVIVPHVLRDGPITITK